MFPGNVHLSSPWYSEVPIWQLMGIKVIIIIKEYEVSQADFLVFKSQDFAQQILKSPLPKLLSRCLINSYLVNYNSVAALNPVRLCWGEGENLFNISVPQGQNIQGQTLRYNGVMKTKLQHRADWIHLPVVSLASHNPQPSWSECRAASWYSSTRHCQRDKHNARVSRLRTLKARPAVDFLSILPKQCS